MKHRNADVLKVGLDALAGSALIVDADLRIRLASAGAETLLDTTIPEGTSATKLLCGDRPKRPFADALLAGRAAEALVQARRGGKLFTVRVRAMPLPARGRERGYLLLLDDAGGETGESAVCFHGMWTRDPRMKDLFRVIERVSVDDDTVLIRGETGSGKELVANAVHALSPRRAGPLRVINCAALPLNLLESELFGHARGAFTGAHKDAPGHVQLAHKGTLFLDEVAELPLELQAKLLRMLDTHTVLPVGAREAVPVDVRVVSATHRALRKEVEAGRFRADLMYRLRVIPIFLPPLRERIGDIALLCEKLTAEMNAGRRRQIERISPAVVELLQRHSWPGNVRELRNVLAYAYAIGDGPLLVPSDLPVDLVDPSVAEGDVIVSEPVPERDAQARTDASEAARITAALERVGGNRAKAAKVLGMSRVTLWRRMRELRLLGDEDAHR